MTWRELIIDICENQDDLDEHVSVRVIHRDEYRNVIDEQTRVSGLDSSCVRVALSGLVIEASRLGAEDKFSIRSSSTPSACIGAGERLARQHGHEKE